MYGYTPEIQRNTSCPAVCRFNRALLSFCLLIILSSCTSNTPPLRISTAASNQFAIEAIAEAFTQQIGIETELIVGSSGKLTAQILAGAPFDVFISADDQYPDKLQSTAKLATSPQQFARGSLVLWTSRSGQQLSLDSLAAFAKIAIASPQTAPFGALADSLLRQRPDYATNIAPKLVFGESISQVNQFVLTGAVDLGITARSIVNDRSKGKWAAYHPEVTIPQMICLLKGKQQLVAIEFAQFLSSEEGQKQLRLFGYTGTE